MEMMMTTKWMHRASEIDGEWTKVFGTMEKAAASLRAYALVPADEAVLPYRRYPSDIGGEHFIAKHDGLSTKSRDAYRAAYDARECGIETKAQVALLARIEGTR